MPINLIIPMAGIGDRFKRANYKNYKPFIKIHEKFMYEYVTKNFPIHVKVWIITCRKYINEFQLNYLKKKKVKLLFITPHKLGPAYSIFKCKDKLPLNESFFISYCDIDWDWDFKRIEEKTHNDGIVFTHNKFHPHKLLNNYSAFCKTKKNKLIRIKEKESFTKNWINEDLSIGVFYIKSGHDMINSISNLIKKNITVSNEYFPSLIFNELVKIKKKIIKVNIDYFIHWGVPDQLEDYKNWYEKITKIKKKESQLLNNSNNELVMCMGGKSERIKKLKMGNKAFINIFSKPMFQFISQFFPHNRKSVIITKKLFNEKKVFFKSYTNILLSKNTNSQIETLKLSQKELIQKNNFFLLSSDAFGFFNNKLFDKISSKENNDAIIFVFQPTMVQENQGNAHTYISFDYKGKIKSVNIKNKKNSNDLGLAGFFWFKNGKIFDNLSKIKINQNTELVIDHFIKYLLKKNYNISYVKLEDYIHLGTVNELLEFNFWKKKFS